MPQVAVEISGKTYRMACGEGEERHLMDLARKLDNTINDLRSSFGEIGDQRLTVMAGVTMADELSESQARVRVLEADIKDLRRQLGNQDDAAERNAAAKARETEIEAREVKVADAIERTAERLETVGEAMTKRSNGSAEAESTPE